MVSRTVLRMEWHQIGMGVRRVLWNSHTGLGGMTSHWQVGCMLLELLVLWSQFVCGVIIAAWLQSLSVFAEVIWY